MSNKSKIIIPLVIAYVLGSWWFLFSGISPIYKAVAFPLYFPALCMVAYFVYVIIGRLVVAGYRKYLHFKFWQIARERKKLEKEIDGLS